MASYDLRVSLTQSVRRFFEVIRIEKKEVSSIYLYAILGGLIQLSLPLGIQAIINFAQVAAGSKRMPASMWLLIILVVVGVLLAGLVTVNQMKVVEKIQQRLFSRYAFEFTFKIPRFEVRTTDGHHLPELVNRFFDTVSLQKALSRLLLEIPLAVIQVIFGLTLLSFYNPIFILLGLLLLLVLYLVLRYSAKRGLEASIRESGYKYSVANWIEEIARGFKTFKVFGHHNIHLKKTDELLEGYLEARTEHFMVLKLQYWSLIIFKLLITASMLFIGAFLLINQTLNIGQFIAAEIVIITVLAAVEKLILSLDKAYDVLTSLEKLSSVTDNPLEESGNLVVDPSDKGIAIGMKQLSFGYPGKKNILKNIDLEITAGQKVCIMGDAASGKSMLMEMMTGALTPFEGSLLYNGIPAGNYDMQGLRRHMGVFYHEQDIFQGTLLENIAMGNESISTSVLMQLAGIIGLKEFIESRPNGFNTLLQPTGKGLSTVIAKKILLMRALAASPRLILLDEPFELAGAEQSKNIISHLIGLKGATVVAVTGNMEFARACDLVVVLEKGMIKQTGHPGNIFNN